MTSLGERTPEAMEWTGWFLSLPLRLAHACWSVPDIATVAARRSDGCLRKEDLPEIGAEATAFGRAVKRIVSGPEAALPAGYFFVDGKGKVGREVRLAWWRSDAGIYRAAALSVPDPVVIPDMKLP